METRKFRVFDFKVLLGLAVIAAGLLLLLDNMGIYIPFRVWDFWPVILILMGISHLAEKKDHGGSWGGWIFIIIGSLFLLRNLDLMPFHFRDLWPLFLIIIGISLLRHGFSGKARASKTSTDFINLTFMMGGGDYRFQNKDLQGGRITAIMGGGTIDLREADFTTNTIDFDLFALWGGIEVIVPPHWTISVQGTPILGGVDNLTRNVNSMAGSGQAAKNLSVRATAIMGGIEIKN